MSFREPRLFGSRFSLDTSLYRTFAFRESYREDSLGYSLGIGHPIYEAKDDTLSVQAAVRWRQEIEGIRNLGTFAVPGAYLFRGENQINVISGTIRMRMLDDIRDPTFEMSNTVAVELAGTFLGGDIDFYKLSFANDWSRVLFTDEDGKKHRLFGNLICQYGEALEDTPELPPNERFYAGGQTFRGFQFRGLGPHVLGRPTGGEWLLKGTLEYEFPIIKDTVGIVVFADAGTLATSLWEDDAWLWRLSVGSGLRLVIPLLGERPLALDFGFPILFEDEDERTLVSFSLGRSV